MPSLLTFPIFFKQQLILEWDILRSSAHSQVLLHGLHSTNSLKISSLRSDEHPDQGSSLSDILPEP